MIAAERDPHSAPAAALGSRRRGTRSRLARDIHRRKRPRSTEGVVLLWTSRQWRLREIVHLRWKQRLGPVAIGDRVGLAASTVHAVLVRCRLNRLSHVDRVTAEPVRRYEHAYPGAMLHVDVRKLGNIPDGGGWRYAGRAQGGGNRSATPGKPRSKNHEATMGTAFVHTVIDDHSRVAYAEVHDDETSQTAIAVLRSAVAWFAVGGVRADRVLSDNGSC